jgi:hypothetical protein
VCAIVEKRLKGNTLKPASLNEESFNLKMRVNFNRGTLRRFSGCFFVKEDERENNDN